MIPAEIVPREVWFEHRAMVVGLLPVGVCQSRESAYLPTGGQVEPLYSAGADRVFCDVAAFGCGQLVTDSITTNVIWCCIEVYLSEKALAPASFFTKLNMILGSDRLQPRFGIGFHSFIKTRSIIVNEH